VPAKPRAHEVFDHGCPAFSPMPAAGARSLGSVRRRKSET
jgi:hypothetical protein